MLSERQVRQALQRPCPAPPWGGEPLLGGMYGEEEVEAAVAAIRASMDPQVGCVVANRPVYQTRRLLREATPGQCLPVSGAIAERLFCVSLHPAMSEPDNVYAAASLIDCVRRLRRG